MAFEDSRSCGKRGARMDGYFYSIPGVGAVGLWPRGTDVESQIFTALLRFGVNYISIGC